MIINTHKYVFSCNYNFYFNRFRHTKIFLNINPRVKKKWKY